MRFLRRSCKSDEWKSLELLEGNELNASGWSKSGPDWDETFVEAQWSLFLKDAHESATKTFNFSSFIVHLEGSAFIEWRNCAGKEETGRECCTKLKEKTLEGEH